MRHGLASTTIAVIDGVEDPTEYLLLRDAILEDLDVRGPVEMLLGERIAQLFWRLRRVLRVETEHLSQAQRALIPAVEDLNAMLREKNRREVQLRALGQLLLPGNQILAPEVVVEILDTCIAVLAEPEQSVFRESIDQEQEGTRTSGTTVAALTAIIHRAEDALCAAGSTSTNVPARAYEEVAGASRAWAWGARSAEAGREQPRTEALLLELAQAGVVERYEPRLRQDLHRTLNTLLNLQTRRERQKRAADAIPPNEPTALTAV